jgi:hypothetical protein
MALWGRESIMDIKTFLGILAFLLIVGTMASMMGGGTLPVRPVINLTIGSASTDEPTTCDECTDAGLLGLGCIAAALACLASTVYYAIVGFVTFLLLIFGILVSLAIYLAQLVAFFTGITNLMGLNGVTDITLPEPFNFIAGIMITFAWLLVAAEFVRRMKAMVFPQ